MVMRQMAEIFGGCCRIGFKMWTESVSGGCSERFCLDAILLQREE